MADEPNTKSTADNDPQPAPPSNTPDEMNEAELEKVSGGVTASDFSFTKKIDKSSPTLG